MTPGVYDMQERVVLYFTNMITNKEPRRMRGFDYFLADVDPEDNVVKLSHYWVHETFCYNL